MNKPTKPNITIPESFAANGVKADFDNNKILNGFDRIQPDVLAGDNLNKFIDDTYKASNYALNLGDYIDEKVSKSGDTMTGVLNIEHNTWGSLILKNSNIDINTPPSAKQYMGMDFRDKTGNRLAFFGIRQETTGETFIELQPQKSKGILAPTPPTGDKSDKIATTAWVNNNKSTIASWSSPDWSRKESKILNTTYTANKNGFILFTSDYSGGAAGGASLKINGEEVIYDYHGLDADDCHCYAPVAKNDTYNITCAHPAKYYYFVPCKEV